MRRTPSTSRPLAVERTLTRRAYVPPQRGSPPLSLPTTESDDRLKYLIVSICMVPEPYLLLYLLLYLPYLLLYSLVYLRSYSLSYILLYLERRQVEVPGPGVEGSRYYACQKKEGEPLSPLYGRRAFVCHLPTMGGGCLIREEALFPPVALRFQPSTPSGCSCGSEQPGCRAVVVQLENATHSSHPDEAFPQAGVAQWAGIKPQSAAGGSDGCGD